MDSKKGRTKKHLLVESILFLSVVKWALLATVVGIVVGASTTLFLKTLDRATAYTGQFNYYYLLLPVAMLVSVLIARFLKTTSKTSGIDNVVQSVHLRSGLLSPRLIPDKFISTVITLAAGGSVGKEGPSAQIGAALTALISKIIRLDASDRKKLVICGVSAGFSSVFGTPIAGSIFGLEMLFLGRTFYDALLPSFIAGVVGFQVALNLGIHYDYQFIDFVPKLTSVMFLKTVVGGIVFGLISLLYIEAMHYAFTVFSKMKVSQLLRPLIGGAIIIPLAFLFAPEALGLGSETISAAINGGEVPLLSPLWKILFTSLSLAAGGSGGVITPSIFIGSTSGNLLGSLLNIDPGTFAAIGMVSVLAGAANTPIAMSIMALELFGPQVGPYAAISCITSFLIVGHRSIFPSQVISSVKSSSVKIPVTKSVGGVEYIDINIRARSLAGLIKYVWIKMVRALKEERWW